MIVIARLAIVVPKNIGMNREGRMAKEDWVNEGGNWLLLTTGF